METMEVFILTLARKVFLLLSTLTLWFLFLLPLYALDPQKRITQYDIRVYLAEHGLPMNSIKDVFQDSKGYLWIATQEGLVRFDGVRFVLFDKSKYPGLKEDFILDIAEDWEGNLWLGSNGGGVSRFDGKTFTTFDTSHGLVNNVVFLVVIGKDHTIWFGTENGLSRRKEGAFTNYTSANGLIHNWIMALHEDRRGNLLIGTGGSALNVFKNDSILTFPVSSGYEILSFYERHSGEVLAGTAGGELYIFKDNTLVPFHPYRLPSNHVVRAIHEDREGNLWFCTEGNGIVRYTNGRFESLTVESGLPGDNNFFFKIMEDREKSLWFTSDAGLYQLKDNKFITFGRTEGFRSNFGTTICEDQSGKMWAGFRLAGISKFDKDTTINFGMNDGLLNDNILAIIPVHNGGLWIGMADGLSLYKENKFIFFPTRIEEFSPDPISLFEKQPKRLWMGMNGGFLGQFDGRQFIFYQLATEESGDVVAVLETANGEVWAGTRKKGLYKLSNGQITRIAEKDGFAADGVNAFYEDENQSLWIGTDGQGLYRYQNGKFFNFTTKNGLFFDRLFSILEDDHQKLWFSGNKGVFNISKQQLNDFADGKTGTLICQAYDHLDGMREAECNGRRQPVAWKSRDGRLWFVGAAGVVSIDPNNIPFNHVPPPVYIENIVINQKQEIEPDSLWISLEAEGRNLEFRYTALSFVVPERVRFKYKLEGYDNEWVDAGTRRSAFYTNLSKGRYTFRVIACNNDGVWNEEGDSLQLQIAPFWWETGWAYLLYTLIAGLILYAIRSYEVKRIRLKNKAKSLQELDHVKSRFFAGISHEFRTPLTLIMGPLQDMLSSAKAQSRSPLTMMLRNTRRLERLVNQLLDLAQLESGKMSLQARPVQLIPFLKNVLAAFESHAIQRNITLKLDILNHEDGDISSLTVYFDPEKMEKVLVNLLANALKYTPEAGSIQVTVIAVGSQANFRLKPQKKSASRTPKSTTSKFIEIRVSDTGIGMPEAALPHIFDYFYRYQDKNNRREPGSGIGLALCKELVELHHGEIFVDSKEGVGSQFTLRLPLGETHLKPEEIANEKSEYPEDLKLKHELTLPDVWEDGGTDYFEKQTAVHGEPHPKTATILLVEDNPDMRNYLCQHLTRHYRLLEAHNGEEGYEKAVAEIPDIIISDVMMPKMDGFEMCRKLKNTQLTSHIAVILLTAKGSGESRLEGLELGADEYLTKPFDSRELHLRIRNILEQQHKMQERFSKQMMVVHVEPTDIDLPSREKEFMQKALQIIEERMSNAKFDAATFARLMGESEKQLNRKIHKLFGSNTTEFIRSMRLKRAARLLQQHAGTVSEIAFDVGFSNLSYFALCFKQQYGKSPSEFLNATFEK